MTKPRVVAEKIHLEGVRIIKSHFEVLETEDKSEIATLSMGFKSEAGFNIEEKSHRFRLYVKIKGMNDKNEFVGVSGEYQIDFFFSIENLEEFIHREGGEDENKQSKDFSISQALGATIAGIAYSTSRGIILDRTQSTDFNGVLLPVMNPSLLLAEDSFSDL